jgi:hypothetical protein
MRRVTRWDQASDHLVDHHTEVAMISPTPLRHIYEDDIDESLAGEPGI